MSQGDTALPVAVVGVGRMGRHHARTYAQNLSAKNASEVKLPGAKLLAVVDFDEERRETVADLYGCDALPDVETLLKKYPDVAAVTVATPTQHHLAAARPLLEHGVACLVEKPMAPTVDEARELADIAKRHNVVLQVGHTERFNPAVRAVAAMNVTARFMEVDRVSPMTFRSLDVGVVMDMMIHDLDIVLMLARSPIAKVDAAGVAVLTDHEDIASARITFENGCVANLAASRLALKTERKMRVFSDQAYVSLDYQAKAGMLVRKTADHMDALKLVRDRLAAGQDLSDLDYSSLIHVEQLEMGEGVNDPLTLELSSFLAAVRGGDVEVNAEAGIAAVDAAQRVVQSLREHKWDGMDGCRV